MTLRLHIAVFTLGLGVASAPASATPLPRVGVTQCDEWVRITECRIRSLPQVAQAKARAIARARIISWKQSVDRRRGEVAAKFDLALACKNAVTALKRVEDACLSPRRVVVPPPAPPGRPRSLQASCQSYVSIANCHIASQPKPAQDELRQRLLRLVEGWSRLGPQEQKQQCTTVLRRVSGTVRKRCVRVASATPKRAASSAAQKPCAGGEVRLTYDIGLNTTSTNCFTAQGRAVRSKRHGKWTFRHDDIDPIIVVGRYRYGTRHGLWTTTLKKDISLGCEGSEPKSYLYIKMSSGRYVKGRRHGKWRFDLRRNDDTDGPDPVDVVHYKAGVLHGRYFSACLRDRWYRKWSESGRYRLGRRVGKWVRKQCYGSKKEKGIYVGGKREGLWTRSSPKWKLGLRCRYKAGRQVGKCRRTNPHALKALFQNRRR